jgi:hypothetical protein
MTLNVPHINRRSSHSASGRQQVCCHSKLLHVFAGGSGPGEATGPGVSDVAVTAVVPAHSTRRRVARSPQQRTLAAMATEG